MRVLVTILFCLAIIQAPAQQSPFSKFGKVTADHLRVKQYALDSNASAVVLSDIGHVSIKGNKNSSFSLYFIHHKVVHILKKDGYDMAEIEIPLFKDGETIEKLEKIKAVTYNLENGKLIETKLDKSSIFLNKLDKKWEIRKFSMPKVKEGSIIEIEYEVSSDFLRHIDPWNFQGGSPRLWSEFIFSAPSFFTYTFLRHGYQDLFFEDRKDKVENFTVNVARRVGYVSNSETVNFTAGVTEYRWVMKNVPGLKPENFTSSLENHTSRIEFQLSSQREPLEPRSYIENWVDLARELEASESFGQNYNERDHWIPSDFRQMISAPRPALARAEKIYEYVRDGFNCTGNRGIYAGTPLKNVVKTKKGTTAELNLMLTALLRSAGYIAHPVLISTRPNGFAYQEYASLAQFNYVIVQVELGGKKYYLDGSHRMLGFGKLFPECYNGHARIVDEDATPVYLEPDSLTEKKVVIVLMRYGKNGQWDGSMKKFPGYFESLNIRQKIRESGEKDFFDQEVKELETEVKISRSKIDSLKNYNQSLGLEYDFEVLNRKEEIIYFNPLFGEGFKKNPFESLVRHYPVEMPYLMDQTYILNMDIPEGYTVDELPQQLLVKVDQEGSGQFEYRITQTPQTISLRMVLRFSKTNFAPEEYGNLREFFGMITAKQAQHIVFKKKQ